MSQSPFTLGLMEQLTDETACLEIRVDEYYQSYVLSIEDPKLRREEVLPWVWIEVGGLVATLLVTSNFMLMSPPLWGIVLLAWVSLALINRGCHRIRHLWQRKAFRVADTIWLT